LLHDAKARIRLRAPFNHNENNEFGYVIIKSTGLNTKFEKICTRSRYPHDWVKNCLFVLHRILAVRQNPATGLKHITHETAVA